MVRIAVVELPSRRIGLTRLRVDGTYAGLIEGVPTASSNAMMLANMPLRAQQMYGPWPVHVIDPPRKLIGRDRGPRHTQERMPPVTCIGMFESRAVGVVAEDWGSSSKLIVVWFQDDMPAPFSPDALLSLEAIPWDELAQDWDWEWDNM